MRNVFEYLVNTGMDQLELIADAEKKATICAELAKAIAQSGLLAGPVAVQEVVEEEVKDDKKAKKTNKKSTKKDALKPEASKVETAPTPVEETTEIVEEEIPAPPVVEETVEAPQEPVMEEVAEQPQEPVAQEPEMVDEWTDEMCEVKAEQLELLNAYVEAWGEDYVYGDCLSAFSEGTFSGAENVRPSNIDGFVVYLQELNSQFSQE